MIDDIIPEEEMKQLTERIWEKSKAQIEKDITDAILSELRMSRLTEMRRRINKEFDSIITPLLAAKRKEMEEGAQRIIDSLGERIVRRALEGLEVSLKDTAQYIVNDSIQGWLGSIQRSMNKVLDKAFTEEKEKKPDGTPQP